jgi:hypothetical protein
MDATTTQAPADPLAQYRSWASVLLAVLGAVALIGGALVIPAASAPYSIVLLFTVGLGALLFIGLALGVGRGDAWAIHAIAPVCVLLIVTGLIRTAVAFGSGTITIPLELLAAVAVITRDHRPEHMPAIGERGRRRMSLVVVGLVVSQLLPFVAEPAMRGGFLAAREEDLTLEARVDCSGVSEPGAPIVATVAWSWVGGRPFAPPEDGLVVRWSGNIDGQTPDVGLVLGEQRASDDATIAMGSAARPDALLEGFRRSGLQSIDFLISRSGSGLRDGSVELDLLPNAAEGGSGSVDLQAAYAHGDLWVVRSNRATCGW